jgi:hypothetical protein
MPGFSSLQYAMGGSGRFATLRICAPRYAFIALERRQPQIVFPKKAVIDTARPS